VSDVKPGQVWRDNDPRIDTSDRGARLVRVERIEEGKRKTGQGRGRVERYAVCASWYERTGDIRARVVRIRLDRFRSGTRGFTLVSDTPFRSGL